MDEQRSCTPNRIAPNAQATSSQQRTPNAWEKFRVNLKDNLRDSPASSKYTSSPSTSPNDELTTNHSKRRRRRHKQLIDEQAQEIEMLKQKLYESETFSVSRIQLETERAVYEAQCADLQRRTIQVNEAEAKIHRIKNQLSDQQKLVAQDMEMLSMRKKQLKLSQDAQREREIAFDGEMERLRICATKERNDISAVRNENLKLQSSLNCIKQEKEHIEELHCRLNKSYNDMKAHNQMLVEERDDANRNVSIYKKKYESMMQVMRKLQCALKTYNEKLKYKEKELHLMIGQLRQAHSDKDAADARCNHIEGALHQTNERLNTLRKRIELDKRKRIRSSSNHCQYDDDDNDESQCTSDDDKISQKTIRCRRSSSSVNLEEAQHEIMRLKQRIGQSEEKLLDKDRELVQFSVQLRQLQQMLQENVRRHGESAGEHALIIREAQSLKDELEKAVCISNQRAQDVQRLQLIVDEHKTHSNELERLVQYEREQVQQLQDQANNRGREWTNEDVRQFDDMKQTILSIAEERDRYIAQLQSERCDRDVNIKKLMSVIREKEQHSVEALAAQDRWRRQIQETIKLLEDKAQQLHVRHRKDMKHNVNLSRKIEKLHEELGRRDENLVRVEKELTNCLSKNAELDSRLMSITLGIASPRTR